MIWGGVNGVYMIVEHLFGWSTKEAKTPFTKAVRMGVTFVAVLFTWILFRANSWEDGCFVVQSLFNVSAWGIEEYIYRTRELLALNRYECMISLMSIVLLLGVDWLQEKKVSISTMLPEFFLLRWAFYIFAVIFILFFAEFGSQQFIYFQF